MRWEDTPTGHRCPTHGVEFDRGESCVACILEPGEPLADAPREQTHLERELEILEHECHTRAKTCWRHAGECFENKDFGDGCKLSAESTKWTRLALEIHEKRTQKHELADLIKKYRALLGKDGSN